MKMPVLVEERASAEARARRRSKPRKFYLVQYKAHARAYGVEHVNKESVFGEGYPRTFAPPGLFDRGFRNYPIVPRYRVSTRLGRMPCDIEQHGHYWLVSDKAKCVLSELSDLDFNFLTLDTQMDEGQEPAVFWLCDVMPVLDPVDESKSEVTIKPGDSGEPIYQWRSDIKLSFIDKYVEKHHVFRLKKAFNMIVCDEVFRQALRDAKMTGLRYQDLTANLR